MPQKPLSKPGAKKQHKKSAANKHGKAAETTKKGKVEKPPKKGKLLEIYKDNKEITKMINKRNEGNAAAQANNKGGQLKTVKELGAPPALAPKDVLRRKNASSKEEEAAPMDASDDENSD